MTAASQSQSPPASRVFKDNNKDNRISNSSPRSPSATPYTPFSPFKKSKARTSKNNQIVASISTSDSIASLYSTSMHSHTNVSPTRNNNTNKNNNYKHLFPSNISSKSEIVSSPNGKSIQLAPLTPPLLSTKKKMLSDSTTISPIFRNDIRQEWINAMFGVDFFPKVKTATTTSNDYYTPPRQGMGSANIPSYLSYTATIPSTKDVSKSAGDKVGLTLSRIPIGVYVRLVDIESEAYAAGIIPGSVLIDINGMGVLGEPSHKLLERIWTFEGHFDEFHHDDLTEHSPHSKKRANNYKDYSAKDHHGMNGRTSNHHKADHKENNFNNHGSIITLKLIKDGIVYNAILLSGTPMGISWAPCGNFALVQRTYAMAQKAGVRRGCIVAAVNDKSLREMNHLDTAMYLKDQFEKGVAIRVVCVYTPAASRSGYHERKNANAPKVKSNELTTVDGVRIRKVSSAAKKKKEKPLEYGVGSFFSCGTGINYIPNSADTSLSDFDVVMEIANRVAAGEIAAPTGIRHAASNKSQELTFSKLVLEYMADTNSIQEIPQLDFTIKANYDDSASVFPKLTWMDAFPSWDGLESIVFCLRMHLANYCEETFHEMGGIIGVGGVTSNTVNNNNGNGDENFGKIPFHSKEANIRLIKSFGSCTNGDAFHMYILQLVAFISSRELFERIVAEAITQNSSELKSSSISNEKELMEKLHMDAKIKTELILEEIINSIIAMAIRDDALCQSLHFLLRSFSSTIVKKKVDDENVFAPIKMLTSAHCLLRNRLLERDMNGMTSDLSIENRYSGDLDRPVSSSLDSMNGFASVDGLDTDRNGDKKSKGKRFGKLFRRRNKNGSSKDDNPELSHDSLDSSMEQSKPATSNRKSNFKPNSILRKSADQDRQGNKLKHGHELQIVTDAPATALLFENMGWFLSNLDQLCGKVEDALLKSFSQKVTEWALQPWSASKDKALSEGTVNMRNGLRVINSLGRSRSNENTKKWSPVINPVNPAEYLVSIIPEECYILPSAHFPLLLTFSSCARTASDDRSPSNSNSMTNEVLYRTTVKVNLLKANNFALKDDQEKSGFAYFLHAAVGGNVKETGKSSLDPYYESSTHRWHEDNILQFETRSTTGYPGTIMFRLSSISFDNTGKDQITITNEKGMNCYSSEVGFSFIQLDEMWLSNTKFKTYDVLFYDYNSQPDFDQQGNLTEDMKRVSQKLSIEVEVTTEAIQCVEGNNFSLPNLRKQVLLYKHDEDMRQEMLATQFVEICDRILKASGLDLKLKKYRCIPVGEKKGFIEWVPGVFSLSELCKPMGSTLQENTIRSKATTSNNSDCDPSTDGDSSNSAFIRTGGWCQFESLRSLRQSVRIVNKHGIGLSGNNPVQEYFRSHYYDDKAPYFIQKEVMDNFVKSCAGYSVITYLLGVGDRHTDNLLLHPKGHFLHCDYSFILGQDPKTYLPMRITDHMVNGMGGRDSDNFAKFLSLSGAAFVTLRRHQSVRVLLSMVRAMVDAEIPDVSINQNSDVSLQGIYERFRLDLSDDEAVSFLEENIERSISSKIWIAVDAIHSLGKRF